MKNIVACVDFSKVTSEVIETALVLAKAFRARVHLLHVLDTEQTGGGSTGLPFLGETPTERIHRGHVVLNDLRDRMGPKKRNVLTILLLKGRGGIVEAILKTADKINADLIVLGSHGHGAFYEAVLGSTAEGVLRKIKCSLLVVPTRGPGK